MIALPLPQPHLPVLFLLILGRNKALQLSYIYEYQIVLLKNRKLNYESCDSTRRYGPHVINSESFDSTLNLKEVFDVLIVALG